MIPKPYYEEHKEYLSEKLSAQYECTTESKIFTVFFIVIVVIALLVGICL
jgi:hypothetical protein